MILGILKIISPYFFTMLIFLSIPLIIYLIIFRYKKIEIESLKFKKISKISAIVAIISFVGASSLLSIILIDPKIEKIATILEGLIFSTCLFFITYFSNKKNNFFTINNLLDSNLKILRLNYSFIIISFSLVGFSFLSYIKYFVIDRGATTLTNELNSNLIVIFLGFFSSVLIGPVSEEFFFRGLIYQSFKLLGKNYSMVISAIMWALIHPFGIARYTSIIISGILLSHMYDKTSSLILPILIHALWNFWISFGMATKYYLIDKPNINPVYIYLIVLAILCAITLVVRKITLKRYLEG